MKRPEIGGSPDEKSEIAARKALVTDFGVSRETFDRLKAYVGLLLQWQDRINLISPATIQDIWSRHILDSMQLVDLKPGMLRWADLGSGAGLPGLVIACTLAGERGAEVHLVESNGKKAAFLRHVVLTLSLPVVVHAQRIEEAVAAIPRVDVVTARALAPLDDLIDYSNLLLKRGAIGLFPKGRGFEEELTQGQKNWHFSYALHRSVTDSEARIIEVALI